MGTSLLLFCCCIYDFSSYAKEQMPLVVKLFSFLVMCSSGSTSARVLYLLRGYHHYQHDLLPTILTTIAISCFMGSFALLPAIWKGVTKEILDSEFFSAPLSSCLGLNKG